MLRANSLFLNMLIVWFTVICDSKAISRDTTKLTRVLEIVEEDRTTMQDGLKCEQLPPLVLAELLGQAYNARYMSVNWPVASDDIVFSKNVDNDRNAYTYNKRKANDGQPSFYVDDKYKAEISDRPAWDDDNAFTIESKSKNRKRRSAAAAIDAVLLPDSERAIRQAQQQQKQQQNEHTQQMMTNYDGSNRTSSDAERSAENEASNDDADQSSPNRNKRAYGRTSNSDGSKKMYPWKCESSIRWIDLGPDYFPRYLRTVECTKHYCWYKAFVCKPKSFAVKILRRRQGMCADASNLRKLTVFDFRGEYGEVWKWEEVAINFCCDCAVA